MSEHSALYTGWVYHRRLRPRVHSLRYRAFWAFLDLDEIDAVARGQRLFSHNRANIVSFRDADHGAGAHRPLRPQIEAHLKSAGVAQAAHRIRLLCMPRVLGYGFNPLSIYYCYNNDGALAAVVYEVTNTFGDRHSYVIPCDPGTGGTIRQSCDKQLYVSPFLDMRMQYAFQLAEPGEKLAVSILGSDANGPIISTGLTAQRLPLTDANLLRSLLRHPFIAHKVTAAIHWEALLLWFKGLKVRAHPPPPARPATVGRLAPHRLREGEHV